MTTSTHGTMMAARVSPPRWDDPPDWAAAATANTTHGRQQDNRVCQWYNGGMSVVQ